MRRRLLKGLAASLGVAAILTAGITIHVQREADPRTETVSETGDRRAVVLFHPSRDAGFSDDLSLAIATKLAEDGFRVDRVTMTGQTPAIWPGVDIVAVVSNAYFWAPDRPTRHYLARADFSGQPVLGVIGGAGATGRSERRLHEALQATGGDVLAVGSAWILRPNDEARMDEDNRTVARDRVVALVAAALSRVD